MDILRAIVIIFFVILFIRSFLNFNEKISIDLISFKYFGITIVGMVLIFLAADSKFSIDNRVVLGVFSLLAFGYVIKNLFANLPVSDAWWSIFYLIFSTPLAIIVIIMIFAIANAAYQNRCCNIFDNDYDRNDELW